MDNGSEQSVKCGRPFVGTPSPNCKRRAFWSLENSAQELVAADCLVASLGVEAAKQSHNFFEECQALALNIKQKS